MMLLLPLTLAAQSIKIQGTVVDDSDGTPLPGVTVNLVGTNVSTATDFDGQYEIVTNGKGTLQFSFVGMRTEQRTFSTSSTINVRMGEDTQLLTEKGGETIYGETATAEATMAPAAFMMIVR